MSPSEMCMLLAAIWVAPHVPKWYGMTVGFVFVIGWGVLTWGGK